MPTLPSFLSAGERLYRNDYEWQTQLLRNELQALFAAYSSDNADKHSYSDRQHRTLLVPWMLPGALAAIMWKWLYHGSVGLINQMLLRMHIISAPIPWLASTQFVLISVVLVNVWRGAPFFMVMLFGGLQTIPNELYEAAMIDGAGSFTSFRNITIPLLKPLILTLSLYGFIGAFNFIDIILVLTKGGPAHHTLTLPLYVWQLAFVDMKISYATAVCVLMCLFLVVLLGIMMLFLKKRGGADE
ncbi:carbohydrate ABC transporter permease [Sediminispirochaeta smaragdinae]|uniref:Binding-protein-dependent transport systems inner membrane component n=1 Tax=Sediminispirochaeta smaragdinae (strain DSM 11293 / JCM 15392 / SEBR 4228) TaxID=573413 RepID=E1RBZ4_SEDSS|nr:sugar ABC transporter permease [Sediminispirochaeta smaragdinae]ADK79874.1 binding-protein-dependent transport systems inner membrane component [Sediminispirochaeta smaragdinae DSM 11293]